MIDHIITLGLGIILGIVIYNIAKLVINKDK